MRIVLTTGTLAAAFAIAACTGPGVSPAQPESFSVPIRIEAQSSGSGGLTAAGAASLASPDNLGTHLSGHEEVPARDTDAQAQAIFRVSSDQREVSYKLNVANIENVTQAHIHLAPAGTNGGIVVWLYPSAPPLHLIPGRSQGTLGEGVFTASNFVGALAGHPMSDLLAALRGGGAYVNVHTLQFPGGEIRGQVD